MRSPRKILGIAGGVLVLALLGVALAVWTVDPSQFVGPVLARAKAATGRDITVGGGIELKVGLAPRVVVNDVRVGNAPWGEAPDLLSAKRLELQVALLPLLRQRFEVVRLNLVDPVIALETNADGRGNWELHPSPGTGAVPASEAGPGGLAIGNLAVSRGRLTYRDGPAGRETQVSIDELALSARDANAPIDVELRGTIDGIAVALTGKLPPLAAFSDRSVPSVVSVRGEVAGRKTAVSVNVRRDDNLVALQDLEVAFGASDVKGRVDIRTGGGKSAWTVDLASSALDVADLPAPRVSESAPAAKAVRGASSRFVFTDAAFPFDALRSQRADGEVTIGRLTLAQGRTLERVRSKFTLRDGRLDAPALQASAFGGTLSGSLAVDATRGRAPTVALRLEGRELDLTALLGATGVKREARGGKTSVSLDVTMRGDSPRQWMSSINGRAQAVVGPATLVNSTLDPTATFDRLAEAVNPFRSVNPTTELRCAVIRLPLAAGVAKVDRSIAMETREIDASMSGTLDFRSETIDLSIRPRVRQGIPIEIPQIAELVRFRGSFTKPAVSIDAVASAATIARIGAAIGTGGLSVLGESILAQSVGVGGAGACDVALGKAAPAAPASTAGSAKHGAPPAGADDLGKVLKGLFGR